MFQIYLHLLVILALLFFCSFVLFLGYIHVMSPSPKSSQSPVEGYAEALEVHLSNLQTRLAATLDALDELTRNHELELEELHNKAHILRARCQVFKARAKDAEAERDELREGVNKLVEKGGRLYYVYGGR